MGDYRILDPNGSLVAMVAITPIADDDPEAELIEYLMQETDWGVEER